MTAILGRVVPGVFGIIGLSVIVFLWSFQPGEFGSPPVFFKIFGSLIGSVFMLMGFGTAIFGPAAMRKTRSRHRMGQLHGTLEADAPSSDGYTCPNCGGGLQSDADVSPSGDVKCTFCDRWFNIHRV